MRVLKHFESEMFGDALYDVEYEKNVRNRKPAMLPDKQDVQKVNEYCIQVMTFEPQLWYSREWV